MSDVIPAVAHEWPVEVAEGVSPGRCVDSAYVLTDHPACDVCLLVDQTGDFSERPRRSYVAAAHLLLFPTGLGPSRKGLCADCAAPVTDEARKLNRSGLWCVTCEKARRARISASFADIKASFGQPKDHTPPYQGVAGEEETKS